MISYYVKHHCFLLSLLLFIILPKTWKYFLKAFIIRQKFSGILSDSLKHTIAKVAQAERERKAVIITSEGEVEAAKNMAIAAQTLASSPGAMQLRTLSTLADLGTSPSNNTVWVVPTDLVNNLSQISANLSGRPTNIGRMN